jgi:hypothetical protein
MEIVKAVVETVCYLAVVGLVITGTGYLFGVGFHTAEKHVFEKEYEQIEEETN